MNPIIKGNEILIPTIIGEQSNINAKDGEILAPAPHAFKVDFWELINKLKWIDRDDNQGADRNPRYPSECWSYDEFREVQREIRFYYDNLKDKFIAQQFWDQHYMEEENKPKLLWHLIGRGQETFTAILADTTFAIAFLEQECGFMEFMKRYI